MEQERVGVDLKGSLDGQRVGGNKVKSILLSLAIVYLITFFWCLMVEMVWEMLNDTPSLLRGTFRAAYLRPVWVGLKTLILPLCVIALVAVSVFAQAPAKDTPTLKLTPQSLRMPARGKPSPLWNWSDGAFIGAAIADIGSSQRALRNCNGCYEAGVVKSQWVRAISYAGIEGGLKFFEWKRPEIRGKVKVFRLVVATVLAGVTVNNFRRGR